MRSTPLADLRKPIAALAAAALALLLFPLRSVGIPTAPQATDELTEVVIRALEPRYVAPTRRDRIGRIWAPVLINGKGPFRMVLDTGANRSGVTSDVAEALGLPPDSSRQILLRGVTGSAAVPTIQVDTFTVGDLMLTPVTLPIVADALGGAQGILGTEGLRDKRIYIDFRNDLISISRSKNEPAHVGYVTIPLERPETGLLMFHAMVGGIRVLAIIDTGGQVTIGNEAMRAALERRSAVGVPEEIEGVTADVQSAEGFRSPAIHLGGLEVRGERISYGDMHIFEHWNLTQEPALLI
ncbi:MAG: retropepsin-like aspartic protease, partial [Steroidobacteraceae bacterium]